MTTRGDSQIFQMMEVKGRPPTSTKKLENCAVVLPTTLMTTSSTTERSKPVSLMKVARERSLAWTVNDL